MKVIHYTWQIAFLLLLAVLSSCAPVDRFTGAISPTGSPSILNMNDTPTATSPSIELTATQSSDVTAIIIRPTSEASPMSTPYTISASIAVCPGEGEPSAMPEGFTLPGTIFYQEHDWTTFFRLGGDPLVSSPLSLPDTGTNFFIGFSPNGEWLAYLPVIQNNEEENSPNDLIFRTPRIVLLSASGERLEQVFDLESLVQIDNRGDPLLEEHLTSIFGYPGSYWLNDHLLYLTLLYKNPDDIYSRGVLIPKLFDPFAGRWVDEPLEKLKDRYVDGNVGFSPDVSLALYEAWAGDYVAGIRLRDLTMDTIIWSNPEFVPYPRALIQWAPDSSQVVVSGLMFSPEYNHILILSRDGDLKVIADQTFSASEFGISSYSWSPDSQYLALVTSLNSGNTLFLYDSVTAQYIYRCPLVGYENYPPLPVWSPDGSFIALTTWGRGFPLQVLNSKTGEVFELVNDVFVVGWSDTSPTVWP